MERARRACSPGSVIGSTDAEAVNEVSDYLARIVRAARPPPEAADRAPVHRRDDHEPRPARVAARRSRVISNMDGFGTRRAEGGRVRPPVVASPRRPACGAARRALQRVQAVLPRGHGPDERPKDVLGLRPRPTWSSTNSCGSRRTFTQCRRTSATARLIGVGARALRASLRRRCFARASSRPTSSAVGWNGSATVVPSARDLSATRMRSSTSASRRGALGEPGCASSCARRSRPVQSSGVTRRIVTAS